MIRLLYEGGNWMHPVDPNVPDGPKKVADPIEVKHRDIQKPHFVEMFNSIDNGFKKQHGHNLFGNALRNNNFSSGSSEVYNDPSVSTKRMSKAKPTMGDYDVQIPEEHHQKLRKYLQVGQKHGKFTIRHIKKDGTQTHIIMRHEDTGKEHQIDFEPVEYDQKTQEPTPHEKLAHNSHITDLERGLKGVHHKLLMQSVFSAHAVPGYLQKETGRGKARTTVVSDEEGNFPTSTYSVDKGVREKWQNVGSKNGKPIFREKKPSESEYSKDLPTIYRSMFKREPTENDISDIHSFNGIIGHIKKHIPSEHHIKIFKTFVEKLWHKSAQATSLNKDTDKKIKENAYNELAKQFPNEHEKHKDYVENLKSEYYGPNNANKFKLDNMSEEFILESANIHVAFAAGRFTGPTVEHHKLLSRLFNIPAHHHRVYVMGPFTQEETTDKDPLTVNEKIEQLKKLYPDHAESFIAGTERHTKNPQKALIHTWHTLNKPNKEMHLSVVAGSGNEGIKNKSSAGGSLESYKSILDKYNKTKFPESINPDGSKRGGDLRMNYASVNYIDNPRGKSSGSLMRKTARELDYNDLNHVKKFKSLLHPDMSIEDTQSLMKKIKDRHLMKKESILTRIKNIIFEKDE